MGILRKKPEDKKSGFREGVRDGLSKRIDSHLDKVYNHIDGGHEARAAATATVIKRAAGRGGLSPEHVRKIINIERLAGNKEGDFIDAQDALSGAVVEHARARGLGENFNDVLDRMKEANSERSDTAAMNYASALREHAKNVGLTPEQESAVRETIDSMERNNPFLKKELSEAIEANKLYAPFRGPKKKAATA